MVQVGTKFSSKPRNGYDHVYEITGMEGNFFQIRNTSFPEYDTRGKQRNSHKNVIMKAFNDGDYIILN